MRKQSCKVGPAPMRKLCSEISPWGSLTTDYLYDSPFGFVWIRQTHDPTETIGYNTLVWMEFILNGCKFQGIDRPAKPRTVTSLRLLARKFALETVDNPVE